MEALERGTTGGAADTGAGPRASPPVPAPRVARERPPASYNGVYFLVLLNIALFVADHVLKLGVSQLYLNHAHPQARSGALSAVGWPNQALGLGTRGSAFPSPPSNIGDSSRA